MSYVSKFLLVGLLALAGCAGQPKVNIFESSCLLGDNNKLEQVTPLPEKKLTHAEQLELLTEHVSNENRLAHKNNDIVTHVDTDCNTPPVGVPTQPNTTDTH